jgi:hypothetical protein
MKTIKTPIEESREMYITASDIQEMLDGSESFMLLVHKDGKLHSHCSGLDGLYLFCPYFADYPDLFKSIAYHTRQIIKRDNENKDK